MRIRPTRIRRNTAPFKPQEEEEAVFISVVNTNEDPPNAHQAQHRPVQEEEEVAITREKRGGSALHAKRATSTQPKKGER